MNKVTLSGVVSVDPEFSHEWHGEKFYKFYFDTVRDSGAIDTLLCIVSEYVVGFDKVHIEEQFTIIGEIRTRFIYNEELDRNVHENTVFVHEIEEYMGHDKNIVEIYGRICKDPYFRYTPRGTEITDLVITSKRNFRKIDCIPCVCWYRTARKASFMELGTDVYVIGRLQSRTYVKRLIDSEEQRVTYEVSVISIEEVKEEGEMEYASQN